VKDKETNMKKILVKNKIIIPGKEPVLNELGEVIEMGTQNRYEAGEQIDESGILTSQEEVDFFISQRPQYICEVIDITDQVAQQKINAEALAYLASTDWMVVREVETQVPCPLEVKQLRAEARLRVVR
jgi:hypothetical protein